ncbi:bifunctional metallophosphatase/5'-nucleotidase [Gracilibacillus dipsosauri]|uniref:Bifunctional metallophosphatase/5'-nucleotidase n=1 Tax=Gracilibacillus dipsosauri TaxID=178340 RepID=A0A317KXC2_9BACI|nr:bifunctional UDP-sugar hydrolase/5'-nucleotidase [Gracilibacillus dipsosauri]PWU68161.1 bifunctional metallophosphatase/5'-nucleotidase [Gracilibacillus dipsosauri]
MKERLHFYYTNDLHSHFENWASIVDFLNKKKEKHRQDKEHYWIVDIGDHVDRFHPISEAFRGKRNVELLNDVGYNIATIGNNEGITLEYYDLFHLYDAATFKVVCGNLTARNERQPVWLKDHYTFQSETGIKITVLGLTAPFTPFYRPLGWDVEPPYEYLRRELPKVEQDSDIIILLSHLGLSDDEMIARDFPSIDVIIGGHSHHLLKNEKSINQSILTAAGRYGHFVGEVDLLWDHNQNKLIEKHAYAMETSHMKKDLETEKKLEHLNKEAEIVLQQPVTVLKQRLEVNWFLNTIIIQQLTDHLQKWTDADIAMLNAGLLLDHLEKGPVTKRDIHRICPHPINPCTVKLRGIELLEVIRGAYDQALITLELKGFGFRGKVIGKFVFSGLDIEIMTDEDGIEHVKNVYYQGEEIAEERIYTFATADMFTFGRMFPQISRSKTKQFFLPEFLRDLLIDLLKN